MYSWKWPTIWATASIAGGLFFTLLSGLYIVKPLVLDGEVINFGFPLVWFAAGRKGLFGFGVWHYAFIWQGFIADFIVYGLSVAVAFGIYFTALPKRKKPELNLSQV